MPLKRFPGLATALSLLLAGAAPAHAGPPVPLLWKVSDADNAVYLLGSFHLLRREDYPLSADVDAAFADAEGLVFELAPEEANAPDLPARMARAAMRTRAGTLERDLGPALWGKLQGYAAAHQLPLAQLAAFDPWFIGLTIALMEMGKQGLDPALGLDRHFMEGAARAGKPTAGLERGDEDQELAHEPRQRRDARQRAQAQRQRRAQERTLAGQPVIVIKLLGAVVRAGHVGHDTEHRHRGQHVGEEVEPDRTRRPRHGHQPMAGAPGGAGALPALAEIRPAVVRGALAPGAGGARYCGGCE